MTLCEEAGFDPELRDTVYWVAWVQLFWRDWLSYGFRMG
jgi:hypothetical protein